MKDLVALAQEFPELTVNVKLSDLLESNRQLILETRNQFEQQIIQDNQESYPTVDEVVSLLDVSKTTLWRWAKQRYLIPVEMGGKRRYKTSDIKRLLEGKS